MAIDLSKDRQLSYRGKKGAKEKTPQQVRSMWTKKCLKVWGDIIRHRAGNKCECCGRGGDYKLDAHHIIARQRNVRPGWFLYSNGIALCFVCHRNKAHSLDVDDQIAFREWLRGYLIKRQSQDYDVLKAICQARGRITLFDLQWLHADMSKELK